MKQVTVDIPDALDERLAELAAVQTGGNKSELIRLFLMKELMPMRFELAVKEKELVA